MGARKIKFEEKFLVDLKGKPVGVVLKLSDYRKLLEELEELESIRAFDAAMVSGEKPIPFEEAIARIEKRRG
jgi:PHD/YefM family antitoxin component YafN of YafNO toxin-antitoxin module